MKVKTIFSGLLLLYCCSSLFAQSARTGKDYAVFFVATTFDHQWATLPDAEKEVATLADDLRNDYGFDVKIVKDAKKSDILKVLGDYKRKSYGKDDQLLLFFSMHGYHDRASDAGYLIPKDGLYEEITYDSWLSHSTLQELLVSMPCRRIMVALDACYSGIFGQGKDKPINAVWEMEPDCASKIKLAFNNEISRKYTTAGGDERVPAKSAFAELWHKALQQGYGEDDMLSSAELGAVLSQFRNPQSSYGSFSRTALGDFVFVRKNACLKLPDRDGDGVPDINDKCPDVWGSQQDGCSPVLTDRTADLNAWKEAKRLHTKLSYTNYLIRFPEGVFKSEANEALKQIESDAVKLADDTAWDIAVEKNTPEAYRNYQKTWPNGFHYAEATEKLKTPVTPVTPPKTDPLNLLPITGGTFTMGCTSEQQDCSSDEKPTHQVTVSDFYLDKYEVTQKLWQEIMGSNPSRFTGCDQCPVEQVRWDDVQEFLKKLNNKYPGYNYRLPTEAEWEYAAREGGKSVLFGNGKNILNPSEANFYSQESSKTSYSVAGNYRGKTTPAGSFSPNALGLYDMAGNVLEWCSDWKGTYESSNQKNPTGPASGSYRVLRGGSWYSFPQRCRVAFRNGNAPGYRSDVVGFRLARTK